MNGRFADWLTASWLDGTPPVAARDACRFVGVMIEDPFTTDPLLAEAGSSIYSRAKVDWQRVDQLLNNANQLLWRLLPGTRVIGVGFFDAALNGVFAGAVYLDEAIGVGVASTWSIHAEGLWISAALT